MNTNNKNTSLNDNTALSVGIDIGTTTVSAVVYDITDKKQIEAFTVPHDSYVCSDIFSTQSVSKIMDIAEEIFNRILKTYPNIFSIGLSGQMHGIVYVDSNGKSVSDLMNWQDKRADIPLENGTTTCELIEEITGERVSAGYGIATHYYNMTHGLVPDEATSFCSIMDLFGMKICGLNKPLIHTTVAASFGLFDIKNGAFKSEKLKLLGIDESFVPVVTSESCVIGKCNGIPVSVALGDNQASFLGSVSENADSILVNIGTGSQVSAVSDYRELRDEVELRPFIEGKYLICGSALCGGFAYSMVEKFFRSYAVSAGMSDESQYEIINKLAYDAYENGEKGLDVDVSFLGKRNEPDKKGSIINIDRQNFTPSSLVLGVLRGMCNELYDLYECFGEKKTRMVASGGAVKKNIVLQKLMSERFGMTVSINSIDEEAATGTALFSACAIGKIKYKNGFSEFVNCC